jgi:hypothetical protein
VTVVGGFEFGWWHVVGASVESLVVEPVDVVEAGDLEIVEAPPGSASVDEFGLEQADVDSTTALS